MTFKQFYNKQTLINLTESLQYIIEGTGFNLRNYLHNVASVRNKKFLKDREENGKSKSVLDMIDWDDKKNSLTLFFETVPTYDTNVGIITTKGKELNAKSYMVRLMFEDCDTFLGSKEEFLDLPKKQQILRMNKMIKEGTVKVGSEDKSWYFQGAWENAAIMKYAIDDYPKNLPKQKGVWSKRHKGEVPAIYVTKHILECAKIIPFIADKICRLIRKKYTK